MTGTSTPRHADPEKKGAGLRFDSFRATGTSPHDHGHSHNHIAHARERLRHFLHPDGRKIHVAHSPEEAITLRRQLEQVHRIGEFEIFISGSKEHLEALRKAQAHHKLRREELRSQDPDTFARFEGVYVELDALSHELERVTTNGVSLEAHFNKYGYNAQIRSYDEGDSPNFSGTTTPRSGRSGSASGGTGVGSDSASTKSATERGYATHLKLWKKPVVRQYWHKGILWRASGQQKVQSFELFVDLLYVGILAVIGDAAAETPNGHSLLQFVITFLMSWKIWTDIELVISWFETDDVAQRISILFQLAALFGLTTNITHAFDGTYATLIGFYLAARLVIASYFVSVSFMVPMIRPIMLVLATFIVAVSALWIGSIYVPYPAQLGLIFTALWIDIGYQGIFGVAVRVARQIGPKAVAWLEKAFEVTPGLNIEHRTERMNAFVTLVFGYMVVSILYQSTRNGIDAHYGKAVLGLTQAFCFNWLYFEVDNANLHQHAIRRSALSTLTWNMSHIPFIMGFVLSGGALARLVLVTDTSNSSLSSLSEADRLRSEPDVSSGIRWFYCAGMGIALAAMGFISLSHDHREIATIRLPKRWRLTGRFAVAIVFICLPLATSLDSLDLVGTMTSMLVFVLALELWAASCSEEKLCTRSKPCQYFGRCPKKDLERLVHTEHNEEDVHEILRKGNADGSDGVVGT